MTAPPPRIVGDDGELLVSQPVEHRPPPALEQPDLLADVPRAPARLRPLWARPIRLRLWQVLLLGIWVFGVTILRSPPLTPNIVAPSPHLLSQSFIQSVRTTSTAVVSGFRSCLATNDMWDAPIVVAHDDGNLGTNLYLVSAGETYKVCPLDLETYTDAQFPLWSPDGERVLFSAVYEEEQNLFIWQAPNVISAVTTDDASKTSYMWWARGGEVWYLGDTNLHRIALPQNGIEGEHTSRRRPAGASMRDLTPSPNNLTAAFVASPDPTRHQDSNALELHILRTSSLDVGRLTFDNIPDHQPTWSPDGRYLAWVRGVPGQIWIYDLINNRQFQFFDSRGYAVSNPVWLPSNDGIAFVLLQTSNRSLIVAQMFSGELRLISPFFTDIISFDWR